MDLAVETDELYVISDTHLGGTKGGQIFDSTNALKWLLLHVANLAGTAKNRDFAFVINGDFVDFLAEPQPVYFDPLGACDRLDRILLHEPAFRGILGALRDFLAKPNCQLILNLGNHDLELALPWVRAHFLDMLSEGNAAARVTLMSDGTGCRLRVNGFQVLCAHGNEVDAWNVTDHEKIRRIAREIMRGRTTEPWIPNAGTQMVIDVMNDIKREFPFVDILKPETYAVVPILAALRPGLVGKLAELGKVLRRRTWDGGRLRSGFLGDEREQEPDSAEPVPLSAFVIGERRLQEQTEEASKEMLKQANKRYGEGVRPIDLVAADLLSDQLGLFSRLMVKLTGRTLSEQMQHELRPLAKDRSFELTQTDSYFERFDTLAGPDIDVIVTGHTHLRRALPRKAAQGFYYNTGTWARVAQITEEMLDNPAQFDTFFKAVEAGTLAALDRLDNVVNRFNPVFSAKSVGKRVELRLNQVAGRGKATKLDPVPGTTFELR